MQEEEEVAYKPKSYKQVSRGIHITKALEIERTKSAWGRPINNAWNQDIQEQIPEENWEEEKGFKSFESILEMTT